MRKQYIDYLKYLFNFFLSTKQRIKMEPQLSQEMISRFKQELKGENEEFLSRLTREYSARIARIAWKNYQTHCKFDSNGFTLMPDNTRLYYRKGNTEIVVQEFSPSIRLLKFKGDLFHKSSSGESISKEKSDEIKYFSLSLPYVVFIFKFVEGDFYKLKCFFSDNPLKNLKEFPVKPFLPNVDNKFDVCLGVSFDKTKLEKNNVSQQSSYVLDHFWNSTFTNESAYNFWGNITNFAGKNEKISSLDAWEKSSMEDPLFVINEVEWMRVSSTNFGDYVAEFLSDDQVDKRMQSDIFANISDEFVKEISDTISRNINNVQNSFLK